MRSLGLTLLGVVLAAAPLAAQSTNPATGDSAAAVRDSARRADSVSRKLADAAQRLEGVRVTARNGRSGYAVARTRTATKTPTPLRDVPQAVTVVTRGLIADQGMQSMADVVRYVPGVVMGQGEGHRDQPTIRGNGSTADFFVDGVRDDAQYFRDLYNVERVEALKGSNAMVFGRGGGGGVLNRVTKEPQWAPLRELTVQGGSYDNKRLSADVGQGLTHALAGRLNGVYENSGLYRDGVRLERYGVNPTLTFAPGARRTSATVGYEHFVDHRTVDRGVPSFQGRPYEAADVSTFFGNPDASYFDARINAASAVVAHETRGGLAVRNRTRVASYDKYYQNVYPGAAVNTAGTEVGLSAYSDAAKRHNLFNQTDVTYATATGRVAHTVLVGAEVGRQVTDNFRRTGYFDNTATTVAAPVSDPIVSTPVTFRQSATDADNHVTSGVASVYVQDQLAISPAWQVVAGVRYERFDVRLHNNRTNTTLRRDDLMLSPRLGTVVKPAEPLSLYANYSVSYLPSAGDQFSSLNDVTRGLEPERFTNYEVGAKWDLADRLALTTALYRLDRTNTRAPAPNDPAGVVQTGSQRTNGYELGVSGNVTPAWEIAGGYANQEATITSTTAAATTGAAVPLVPRNTLSLWNRYQVARSWGLGLGVVHQSDLYAAIDNKVTLPGFTRLDGAAYLTLGANLRAQLNLENLLDRKYYPTAHNNNNITPGAPRTVRLSLTTGF